MSINFEDCIIVKTSESRLNYSLFVGFHQDNLYFKPTKKQEIKIKLLTAKKVLSTKSTDRITQRKNTFFDQRSEKLLKKSCSSVSIMIPRVWGFSLFFDHL